MLRKISNILVKPALRILGFYSVNILIPISIVILYTSNINPQQKTETETLNSYGVAFLRTMFLNVDYNDAKAAIKVYIDNLQEQIVSGFSLKPIMFEDTDDLLRNYNKENLAVITLSTIDFLAYRSRLSLYPILVSSGKTDPLETYLILIRKDENINNIEYLADKKIGILQKGNDPIPVMWLNILLDANKISLKEKSFGSVIIVKSESQLILSLFFRQLDACLVSKTAFETMIEINPQIGSQLTILKSSPRYLKAVSSFTPKFRKTKFSDSLLQHLTTLDRYPAGRQLFALTKTAKVIPYKEEYLDNVRTLISDYNKLPKHWIK